MAQEKFLNHSGLEYYDGKIKAHIKSQADAAQQAAQDYADGLADNYDAAGTAQSKVDALANGQVKTNTDAIAKLNGNASTAGSVAKAVADAVATEKSRAEGVEGGLDTRLAAVEGDYLKGADKTELQGKITANEGAIADVKADVDAFFKDADMTESAKDTLKELQAYMTSDAQAASDMLASIQQNGRDIDAVEGRLDTAEGKITANEGAIAELQSAISGTGGSVKDMIDAAVKAEADRATGVEGGLDERIQELEAIDHEHANKALLDTYTQTEANLKDAVDKKHSHTNATVLNGITAEKVAAWDAAEGNAKTHANGLNTAMDTRVTALEGKVGDGFIAIPNSDIDALFA